MLWEKVFKSVTYYVIFSHLQNLRYFVCCLRLHDMA